MLDGSVRRVERGSTTTRTAVSEMERQGCPQSVTSLWSVVVELVVRIERLLPLRLRTSTEGLRAAILGLELILEAIRNVKSTKRFFKLRSDGSP